MFSFLKINQLLFYILIFAYFAVGVFGLFGMATLVHHNEMAMVGCPFMVGETAICEMNVFDHITSWQVMLTATSPQVSVLALLLLMMLFAFSLLRYFYGSPDASQLKSYFSYFGPAYSQSLTSLFLGSAISPRAP